MTKTVLITGASSGIGLAIARRFAAEQYEVFNLDIVMAENHDENDHIHYRHCDITNHDAVKQVVDSIASSQTIDVLVSNAGMHFSANIENTQEIDFDRVMSLNVKGAYSVSRAVIPYMKQKQDGVILFIGSDQSSVGKPNSFVYNISKHALASMAKTIALDYAKDNIRANTLCPGTVETPLYHKAIDAYCEKSGADKKRVHAEEAALQPLGRIGHVNDVAALALFLASKDASFITGALYAVDGGYTTG
ncbi:SDR family NAD(P)-dependent oxidoreductase [Glaciecola petra]|uniref:SDR family oxidoreductase n=1 Tax=Glaciecola petra TaxID=3075602 RepID=A0ABU2ZNE4_9ALTE|nr:SDR family oxidoreductase [Aestuariibacter sp. P117]MDT0594152.1 SDR family oxidoreductase [Aestuariibacter sp. P117]